MADPETSVVVCAHNMERELPHTIRSLSPGMQRGVDGIDYEIVVVDNGSAAPLQAADLRRWGADVAVHRQPSASPSPARAINLGLERARGDLIGVMIDGARLASPGIVRLATLASRLDPRMILLTLGVPSRRRGADEQREERL